MPPAEEGRLGRRGVLPQTAMSGVARMSDEGRALAAASKLRLIDLGRGGRPPNFVTR